MYSFCIAKHKALIADTCNSMDKQRNYVEQKKSGPKEYIISNALQRVPEQVGLIYSERNKKGDCFTDLKRVIAKIYKGTSGGLANALQFGVQLCQYILSLKYI